MGSIHVKQELPNRRNFIILDYGYCIVWKKKSDSLQLMEEYQFCIESQQRLKAYQNVWSLRTKSPNFVNIYYFSHTNSSSFCGQLARGSIFTQRIPYRLSQFSSIPYIYILSIMKKCFQGFKILNENFGLFLVRSTMIGFTQNYNAKIWFHTDFSQPEPQNANCNSMHQMMVSIIKSIQSGGELAYSQYPKFSQFIVKNNYIYVSKDINYLLKGLEQYTKKYNLVLSQKLPYLYNFIKKPEGWEKFKTNTIYPKIISSEATFDQYESQKQMPKLKQDLLFKKRSSQNLSKLKQFQSTVKQPWNKQYKKIETNNRMSSQITQKNQPIYIHNKTVLNYNHNIRNSLNNQGNIYEVKRIQSQNKYENIKFWRSTDKIDLKITQPSNLLKKQTNITRFHSPPSSVYRQPSSQYYGQNLPNLKLLKNNNSTQPSQKLNMYSYDVSTATRNRDKSMDSTISLIQDLQSQKKIQKNLVRLVGYK